MQNISPTCFAAPNKITTFNKVAPLTQVATLTQVAPLKKLTTLAIILTLIVFAGVAQAHGPTIEISHSEMKPKLLNLSVGTTVHFLNTVAMPGGHVIVDAAETLKSPPLAKPGDEWHYTFETEGTYELHIAQHPTVKARIVVVPKTK